MGSGFDAARSSRVLMALAGVGFALTGLIFFVMPGYSATAFPWMVTEFVAMTIGGWTLGMAVFALAAARDRSFVRYCAPMLAMWSFALLELVVVILFLGKLQTSNWLTWPYLVSLVLGVASGVIGLSVVWRNQSAIRSGEGDRPMPLWLRAVYVLFIALVWVLSTANVIRGAATGGNIFPEPLSGFTTLAFAAFFFSLGVGALPLLVARGITPAINYARTGLVLIVLITLAAFVYISRFDFATKRGQYIYLGTYVVAGIAAALIVAWDWRARRRT